MPFPAQDGRQVLRGHRRRLQAGRQHPLQAQGGGAGLDRLVHRRVRLRRGQWPSPRSRTRRCPTALKPYEDAGVEFIELDDAQGDEGQATIDNESEIGLYKPDYRQRLVDIARGAAQGQQGRLLRRPEQALGATTAEVTLSGPAVTGHRDPGRRPADDGSRPRHSAPGPAAPPAAPRPARGGAADPLAVPARPAGPADHVHLRAVANMFWYSVTDWDGVSPERTSWASTTTSRSSPDPSCSRCSASACYYLAASVVADRRSRSTSPRS